MNIDNLLNKYFEGETSAEEEKQLRTFFASGDIPDHLIVYKPLFAYFDEEIGKEQKTVKQVSLTGRKVLYWVSGIAASMLLLLAIGHEFIFSNPRFCSGNYVVINGRCYTDIHKVRSYAFSALQEVATPAEDYFPERDQETIDREIIENQLKELGSIFSDDE